MKNTKNNTKKAEAAVETKAEEKALAVSISEETKLAIQHSRFSSLKSLELAAKGLELDSIAEDVAGKAIVQARIFAEIADGELYRQDGYKNMDECAEALFGQGKSSASQKATAYRCFFADDASDICKEVAAKVPAVSVLYELSRMTDEELKKHLDAGDFNGGISQKAARAMAKAEKEARTGGKQKVVKMFDYSGFSVAFPFDVTDAEGNTKRVDGIILPYKSEEALPLADDDILDFCGLSSEGRVLKAKFDDVTYYIALEPTAAKLFILTAAEHKVEKAKKPDIAAEKVNIIHRMKDKGFVADDIAELVDLPVDVVEGFMA